MVAALVVFFAGFNALEAKLPALVSRAVPANARGLATGIFSSTQFLGMFAGGSLGGVLAQRSGMLAVLGTCFAALVVWFLVASRMGHFTPATLQEDARALAEAEASSGVSGR
jgi:MFS family permease